VENLGGIAGDFGGKPGDFERKARHFLGKISERLGMFQMLFFHVGRRPSIAGASALALGPKNF
jgi:hypothetical protein